MHTVTCEELIEDERIPGNLVYKKDLIAGFDPNMNIHRHINVSSESKEHQLTLIEKLIEKGYWIDEDEPLEQNLLIFSYCYALPSAIKKHKQKKLNLNDPVYSYVNALVSNKEAYKGLYATLPDEMDFVNAVVDSIMFKPIRYNEEVMRFFVDQPEYDAFYIPKLLKVTL